MKKILVPFASLAVITAGNTCEGGDDSQRSKRNEDLFHRVLSRNKGWN